MTTAVKALPAKVGEKTQKESALQSAAKVLFSGEVALALIDVVSNVRKKFEESALKELAANIQQLGRVISPITLRPGKNGRYELVAGERRTRAAKMAGLTQIAAQVLELNDQLALEYQAAENIHRKDLTPIEEARAYEALTKSKNGSAARYTVAELASVIRRPPVHVYRMLSLLALPKKAIDAIEDEILTPQHGLQILRVPEDKRAKFTDIALREETGELGGLQSIGGAGDGDRAKAVKIGVMTAKELELQIDNELGTALSRAQFPKDCEYAGEMACSKCPLNAANQGALFDGATEGRCLSRPCFDKKTEQFYKDLQADGQKKWPNLEYIGRGSQNYYKKRTIEGLGGNAMLSIEEQSHVLIKKLLEKRPGALGYAVVLPMTNSYGGGQIKKWERARLVMVVKDPSLIGGMQTDKIVDCTQPKKVGKKKASSSSSSPAREKPADPKVEFMAQLVTIALADALAEKALKAKLTKEDWREIAEKFSDDVPNEFLAALLGKSVDDISYEDVREANEDQARAIAIVGSRLKYGNEPTDAEFKGFNIDPATVRKEAKAEGEKQWAEILAKQAKKEVAAGKTKA